MVSVRSAARGRIFAKFAAEHILGEAFALPFDIRAELEGDIVVALAGAIPSGTRRSPISSSWPRSQPSF